MDKESFSIEDFKNKLRKKLNQTGFPTEEQTANVLLKNGWGVRRNVWYYSESIKGYRQIDLTANKHYMSGSSMVWIMLVLECKKQEALPWTFMKSSQIITDPFCITMSAKSRTEDANYAVLNRTFRNHYYYGRHSHSSFVSPFFVVHDNPQQQKIDPIHEAVEQVVRGLLAVSEVESSAMQKATPAVSIIYPVVVLDGELLSISVEGEITQEDHISYVTEILPDEAIPMAGAVHTTKPVVVDVVKLASLLQFLQLVEDKGMPFSRT